MQRLKTRPQFQAAITYLWPQSEGGFQSQRAGTSWSGSQILPTGGSLSVSAAVDGDWPGDRGGSRTPAIGTNIGLHGVWRTRGHRWQACPATGSGNLLHR